MTKKGLIIGISVLAVVLLILTSLTNVVGHQSVKSTVIDSPLFNVRTQRATNQQHNSFTSQYLGVGKETLWQFPMRDNRFEQLKKAIDIISDMDVTTFARFAELCIQKARQDDTLRDVGRSPIVQALLLLKTNPEAIINFYTIRNNQELPKTAWTYCGDTVCGAWGPGCLLELIFWSLIVLLDVISAVIYAILTIVLTSANY